MLRVRHCVTKEYCDMKSFEMEEKDCNEGECLSGDWGEWSECEDGWRLRERCDEEWNCEVQDEECSDPVVLQYEKEWSAWGECDMVEGTHTRERCSEDFGCEEELEECDVELSWSDWGPCKHGLQARQKCLDNYCEDEEVQECFTNEWGEWGKCSKGLQQRTRCTWSFGCESEEQRCGDGAVVQSWPWTEWSSCDEGGFQSRHRCDPAGENCFYEDMECKEEDNSWTEWGECKSGLQEREKCEGVYCTLDIRTCSSPDDDTVWTEWGTCRENGRQARMGRNPEFSVTEERACDDEGGWWRGEEEEVLGYEDLNDGYWESYDVFFDDSTEGMGSDMEGWVAYSL